MADGEQGMPLTFQNFLEKMRHPSASELVKSIKVRRPGRYLLNSSPLSVPTRPSHPRAPSLFQSTQAFISSFGDAQMSGNAQRDSDEDGRRIQAFLRDTEAAFRGHPAWRGASEEELEASGEGLEKYLSTKLYPNIFAVVNEERTLDDVLGRRIAALRTFIRPEHLDIPECFRVEASLALARNELVKVNNFKAPRDKLVCVLNTCRVINNLLNVSAGNRPAGADDFLPVLIYVVMLANPPRLESNLRYIARFRLESRLVSEAAYFYTNLVSATHFLTTCDHAAFTNLDADVFEAHMAAEGIAVGDAEGTTDGEGGVDGAVGGAERGGRGVDTGALGSLAEKMLREGAPGATPPPAPREPGVPPRSPNGSAAAALEKDRARLERELADARRELAGANARAQAPPRWSTVEDVEAEGAASLAAENGAGTLRLPYKFLYARADDLQVGDVPTLLNAYKTLALQYEALSRGVGAVLADATPNATVGGGADVDGLGVFVDTAASSPAPEDVFAGMTMTDGGGNAVTEPEDPFARLEALTQR